jgi:hypothetical protein
MDTAIPGWLLFKQKLTVRRSHFMLEQAMAEEKNLD